MQRLVASWFGTGLILQRARGSDTGSGTVGALFAAVIAFWVGQRFGWGAQLGITAVVIALSLWSVRAFLEAEDDPGWIVVDEAAGAFLALTGLDLWPAVAGFLVFRAADILKGSFPGVGRAERLPGVWGVTADDLVAGLYGLAVGQAVQILF